MSDADDIELAIVVLVPVLELFFLCIWALIIVTKEAYKDARESGE